MSNFQKLKQLVDLRGKTKRNGSYTNLGVNSKTDIAVHHSLTEEGSSAAFANYHVGTLGWPGIAYHFVILKNGVIEWNHDLGVRSYHVGNSNSFAVGICVVGDFRSEEPTDAQKSSLSVLMSALKKDLPNYKRTRGHNEFPGYSWKACPEFDYRAVITNNKPFAAVAPTSLPNKYTIQQGDTFWSIANELKGVSVDDLIKANPGVDPTKLRVGQVINLAVVAPKPAPKPVQRALPNVVLHANKPYPSGADVLAVQKSFASVYFYPDKGAKNNGVDGVYGPKTADAVRRFQAVHGLKADGIYGPATRAKLMEVMR